jgi:hypothetical protein
VMLGICGGSPSPLWAEPPQPQATGQGAAVGDVTVTGQRPRTIGGTAPAPACGGENGAGAACTAALNDMVPPASADAASPIDARSPDVKTGVANQTATRLRLGTAFGHSVHPERPVTIPPPPLGKP